MAQKLYQRDCGSRLILCSRLFQLVTEELIMFDEARFELSGKTINWILEPENPPENLPEDPKHDFERQLYPEKVTVKCGVALFGLIIGSYFFGNHRENAVSVHSDCKC